MSNLRKTIPILYNGGAYGTYFEWALTTLSTDIAVESPVTSIGNSHAFFGNQVLNIDGWRQFVKQHQFKQFVRLHPKTKKDQSLSITIKEILDTTENVIILYPDHQSVLLNINNYYTKVWSNWWDTQFNTVISQEKIYQNWPINKNMPIDKIPVWIQREFLSFYLMPAWQDQVEWYYPDQCDNPRVHTVLINDLLYNFEDTVLKIQKYCNLSFNKDISTILPIHAQMLSTQQGLTQDVLCQQIIKSVINKQMFSWNDQYLPLPSQSWVQWQLRNLGLNLACDGLDIFPTDSVQLEKLTYPTHESI